MKDSKKINVLKRSGELEPFNPDKINRSVQRACEGLEGVSANEIVVDAHYNMYDEIPTMEIDKCNVFSARSKIEKEPTYSLVAARLLLNCIYKEVFGEGVDSDAFELQYRKSFITNLKKLIKAGRIDTRLATEFDLKRLSDALNIDRDMLWHYRGIQTVYDRYLIHIDKRRMESPQGFWMRVAMGLALNEEDKTGKAIEFYNLYSQFLATSSTPTLFNSGTTHSQLSSCFPADSTIITEGGLKRIDEIEEGDKVLTKQGNYREVIATRKKMANELVSISLKNFNGGGDMLIRSTPDHMISSIKWSDISCVRNRKLCCLSNVGSEKCFKKPLNYRSNCKYLNKEFSTLIKWNQAEDLKPYDYVEVCYPRDVNFDGFNIIDFSNEKYAVNSEEMVFKLKNDIGRGIIDEESVQTNKVKNNITADYDLGLFLGYYMAEGYLNDDSTVFTFSTEEREYQSDILKLGRKIFGLEATVHDQRDNSTRVGFHSRILAEFMKNICGTGFSTKKLCPNLMRASRDFCKGFISGIFRGDGYSSEAGMGLTLANRELIYQTFQLCLKVGHLPTLRNVGIPKLGTTCQYSILLNGNIDHDLIRLIGKNLFKMGNRLADESSNNESSRRFFIGDRAFYRIESVERKECQDFVWDLEVEEDHTFVVNNVGVHNCYLSTVGDSINGIFGGGLHSQALLSKFAGGLGVDFSYVRGTGAYIHGTNGESQGLVPWIHCFNAMLLSVDQCFHKDTLLHTSDGVKPISEMKKGNLVLGMDGEYREVVDVMEYDQKEDMVRILAKNSVLPIDVTKGHPIFAISNQRKEVAYKHIISKLEKGDIHADWIEAGDLKQGDFVGLPVPREFIKHDNFNEDDALFYGIFLGDGHFTSEKNEMGIAFNSETNQESIDFVKNYLNIKSINFHESERFPYLQIKWTNSSDIPFNPEDVYDPFRNKRIGNKFRHLPLNLSIKILKGLILSDGGIYRDKEIHFYNSSLQLIEDFRYQCLRFGAPCYGNALFKKAHVGIRRNGDKVEFPDSESFDLRVPRFDELAEEFNLPKLEMKNWFVYNGIMYCRIVDVQNVPPTDRVYDLKIDGVESYSTMSFLAHNGGKRRGSGCIYIENWHIDFEDFLELRKNTGDDRRRAHDTNTASWISDLFMQRVKEEGDWTFFDPADVPDLHDLVGKDFEKRYKYYEKQVEKGKIKNCKTIKAKDLWKKMLISLYETGHPWITFKDPSNIRYSNQHEGVVHSSNLCTEILLHTKPTVYAQRGEVLEYGETAVCNLLSINLSNHVGDDGILDKVKLGNTVQLAMRMLDNVIDINFYPTHEAEKSNKRHRPVGLGIMGFHDVLFKADVSYDSDEAVKMADEIQEIISWHAIMASSKLAEERGKYESYDGSLWSQGILPIDTYLDFMKKYRDKEHINDMVRMDWDLVRESIAKYGMRNSNTMAIAPTACVTGDTMLLSSKGILPIEKLKKTEDQWQEIDIEIPQEEGVFKSDKFYVNGERPVITIASDRGHEISSTANHRLRVIDSQGDYVWKYVGDISVGDILVRKIGGHEDLLGNKSLIKSQIPDYPVHHKENPVDLPLHIDEKVSEVIGYYMGDGYLKDRSLGLVINDEDLDVKDHFENVSSSYLINSTMDNKVGCGVQHWHSKRFVEWMGANGFEKPKGNFGEGAAGAFIPSSILASRTSVVASFMRGAFEADGTVHIQKNGSPVVSISTCSKEYSKQIQVVLESLGIRTNRKKNKSGTLGKRNIYRVTLASIHDCREFQKKIGFISNRKSEVLNNSLIDRYDCEHRGLNIKSKSFCEELKNLALDKIDDVFVKQALSTRYKQGSINLNYARSIFGKHEELRDSKLYELINNESIDFVAVKSIKYSGIQMTYDISVPENNTYIANGFVSHNTISYINGCSQSIEPDYSGLFVYSNLSGENTMVNHFMVNDMKKEGLWGPELLNVIKNSNGSIQDITNIPEKLKQKYKFAFEIPASRLIECASVRQKWIDMGQSLNLYANTTSGKALNDMYFEAWEKGLKTTYYLRAKSASNVEKSTTDVNQKYTNEEIIACSIDNPESCEACQ